MASFLVEIIFAFLSAFPGMVVVSKLFKWSIFDAKSVVLGILFWNFVFASISIIVGSTSTLLNYFFYAFTGASILICVWRLVKTLLQRRNLKDLRFPFSMPELPLILFIVVLLVFVALVMAFHPMFVELDAIWAYFPYAKGLVASGGFWPNNFVASSAALARMPLMQTNYAWGLSVFGFESFRLIPLTSIVLTLFAIYKISQELFPEKREISLIAPAVFLTLPVILVSVSLYNFYVDIPLMAFTAASVLCSVMAFKYGEAKWYVFTGTAVALAILSKEAGYIALLISLCIISLKFSRKVRLLGLLIAASPFYFFTIRNILTLDPNSSLYTVSVVFKQIPVIILLVFLGLVLFFSAKGVSSLNWDSLKKIFYVLAPCGVVLFFALRNLVVIGTPILFTGFVTYTYGLGEQPNVLQFLRFDLLFDSTGLGNLYLIFIILGFTSLVMMVIKRKSLAMTALGVWILLLLMDWSFFFNFNYTIGEIRRLLILAPFMSVIIAVGFSFLFRRLSNGNLRKNSIFVFGLLLCIAVLVSEVIFQLDFVRLSGSYLSYIIFQMSGNRFSPVSQDVFSVQSFVVSLIVPCILALGIFVCAKFASLWSIRKFKVVGFSRGKRVILSAIALIAIVLSPLFTLGVPQLVSDINGSQWDSNKYAEKAIVASWWNYMPEVISYFNSSIKDGYTTVSYGLDTTAIAYFLDRSVVNLDYGVYGYSFLRSNSTEELLSSLHESDIRYFLMPNENASSYSNYISASSKMLILRLIGDEESFVLLKEFPCYELYKLKSLDSVSSE